MRRPAIPGCLRDMAPQDTRQGRHARARAGFTLMETLATLMVVTLVSGIAVTCVVMAARQLATRNDVVAARTLAEGLATAVRNELAWSRNASGDADGMLESYEWHVADGAERRMLSVDEAGRVVRCHLAPNGGIDREEPLVPTDGYEAGATALRAALLVCVVPLDADGTGGYYHVEIEVVGTADKTTGKALADMRFDVAPLSGPATLVRDDG